ncbi:MAG: DNA polymerase Y family protein [Pseudomonadales bacterium]|jgi:protein ImuB|nr:DNA polymerase Y family protein [Pseudomonadales bacterium]MDP6826179.1 DNA polymerase Y family protein [Pseudomonadales bacterium]MDP6973444.1 DNA polymerase Y family protein [Pseudomonadales bacterium]
MLWLGVHVPDLGLEIFSGPPGAGDAPERPCVLVSENRVWLCNRLATERGIVVGSTLATAYSIAADLQHFQRDQRDEARRLSLLAEILYQFSSEVSLQPPCDLVLEVSGSLNLFGHLDALEKRVETALRELDHHVFLRTQRTPLAALALARALPLGAKALADVPLVCTGLDDKLIERFSNIGVRSLGPLFRLPADELAQRFGPELTDYLQRLGGEVPDPRDCITPSPVFDHSLHLLEPLPDKDALLSPMQRLLGELQQWLISRQLGVTGITWHFSAQSREQIALPVRFATLKQDAVTLAEISRMRLERAELPEDVLSIRLHANRLGAWCADSHALFEPTSRQAARGSAQAAELIDQLNARLGVNACIGVSETHHHDPELAWQPALPGCSGKSGFEPPRDEDLLAETRRPLWLFTQPHRTSRQVLTVLRGPERIQTGWWRQDRATLYRDYYVVRHNNGARCWAFVDLDQQWYLHGYFG